MAEVQDPPVEEEENSDDNSVEENASLIAKLLSNPEAAALLKALAKQYRPKNGNPQGLPF